jgi:hypothetical protein
MNGLIIFVAFLELAGGVAILVTSKTIFVGTEGLVTT